MLLKKDEEKWCVFFFFLPELGVGWWWGDFVWSLMNKLTIGFFFYLSCVSPPFFILCIGFEALFLGELQKFLRGFPDYYIK